jgi:predicted alpha/beta-fold hydrolase
MLFLERNIMFYSNLIIISLFVFIFLLGISIGHSILTLQLRKEENKKREFELEILNKRSQILKESKEITNNIEEYLYKANVRQEIDNIIGRNEST